MNTLVGTKQGQAAAPLYTAYRRSRRALAVVAIIAAVLAGATIALVLSVTAGASQPSSVPAPGAVQRFHEDTYATSPDVPALQRFHQDNAGK